MDLGNMREQRVSGLAVYCLNHACLHPSARYQVGREALRSRLAPPGLPRFSDWCRTAQGRIYRDNNRARTDGLPTKDWGGTLVALVVDGRSEMLERSPLSGRNFLKRSPKPLCSRWF
jgi:hypothetical protein